ncbi:nuclear RNA export factor 3-like [Bos taurus]|uniref:nuclear RNA export factor 3-like n=1 Tax=Bos taurus TaxID=9913 RepID=UPI0028CBAE27|nr:nuclear RNA export factor 3-like [Bos taurus]
MDNQARHAPYAIPPHHQRSGFQKQDQMHVNMETKQKPPERRMERNRQDKTFGSWFKIIISIFVEPCDTPQSVQKALKSEKVGQLLSLDLSNKKPYLVHGLSTL